MSVSQEHLHCLRKADRLQLVAWRPASQLILRSRLEVCQAWPENSPSRMRKVGSTKSALASAIRMRQPPEKSRVRFCCIAFVNPSPCSSCAALASVVEASSASSLQEAKAHRSSMAIDLDLKVSFCCMAIGKPSLGFCMEASRAAVCRVTSFAISSA